MPTPPNAASDIPAPLPVAWDPATRRLALGRAPQARSEWTLLTEPPDTPVLVRPSAVEMPPQHLPAAIEAAFAQAAPAHGLLRVHAAPAEAHWLAAQGWCEGAPTLGPDGLAQVVVRADTFWQSPGPWLTQPRPPFPVRHVMTQGRRHPLRPPKPTGTVYRRTIPWLGQALTLRTLDPDTDTDLDTFHRWMNDPRVDHFWQEQGDVARHRDYLQGIADDPRVLGLLGCFDGVPFGYFEVYWAREDRIAPFCDAADHDRGWHALVGEDRFRGRPWASAWIPSLAHCLFLDDCRTQRIVIEPRIDNARMVHNLSHNGYAFLKAFDFPHKRALLGVLLRERFFAERLWEPRPASLPPSSPLPSSPCTSTT